MEQTKTLLETIEKQVKILEAINDSYLDDAKKDWTVGEYVRKNAETIAILIHEITR